MWTAFVTKFYVLFFSLIVTVTSITIPLPGLKDSASIDYDFANAVSGSAEGTVHVSSGSAGVYDLYWGDENGDRLSAEIGGKKVPYTEFAEVTISYGESEGETDIGPFAAIPEEAATVLSYRGALLTGTARIPEEKQIAASEPLYIFGALSDVHFNRYNLSLTGDDAVLAFGNALDFLEKGGVSLVAISGDISTEAELDSFEKYQRITERYPFPVYSCTGNHDVGYDEIWDTWKQYVNPGVYGETKTGGVTLAPNGVDFTVAPENAGGDVFVFLSQQWWDYNSPDSRLLDDAQLDWLESQFKAHPDSRIYLYFHTFMADDSGDPARGEGNLINNKGVTYDLTYTVGTKDEVRLRKLLQTYKNVIFFNGHSHWDFDSVSMNERLNITDYGGSYATFVHIPSVSSPRSVTPNAEKRSERYMRSSQGYYVRVYPDRVNLTGVEFWGTRFLGYVNFNIYR